MEALSNPASALRFLTWSSTATHRDLYPLKPLTTTTNTTTNNYKPISSSLSQTHHHHQPTKKQNNPSLPSRDQSCLSKRPITIECRRASSGYAAALMDAARCDGAVDEVERDVARLARMLRLIDEGKVREVIIYGGGFHRHLVVLLKMMARKGKAGLVGEVLEEFGRICCALGQGDQMATII